MAAVTQLGYLGIGAKDPGEWESYAERVLGLGVVSREGDGTLLLRMDGHHHRFAIHEDGRDDVMYAGWQVESASDLDEIAVRLEGGAVAVARGTREEAERRHVRDLIRFSDPDGYDVEVFCGPEQGPAPFASPKGGTSFVAGDQGLGHIVLTVADLGRSMEFYTSMLGLRLSDYVDGPMTLGFLHCNPRHHSLAFAQAPRSRKRINHFMLQLDSIDPVGRTYDSVQEGSAPLLVTMGRHSNDEMVSFYMANPSRFGVEYGWGAREIDDCSWQVARYESGSTWGHRPVRQQEAPPRA